MNDDEFHFHFDENHWKLNDVDVDPLIMDEMMMVVVVVVTNEENN
jgi:hypothetical protein